MFIIFSFWTAQGIFEITPKIKDFFMYPKSMLKMAESNSCSCYFILLESIGNHQRLWHMEKWIKSKNLHPTTEQPIQTINSQTCWCALIHIQWFDRSRWFKAWTTAQIAPPTGGKSVVVVHSVLYSTSPLALPREYMYIKRSPRLCCCRLKCPREEISRACDLQIACPSPPPPQIDVCSWAQ